MFQLIECEPVSAKQEGLRLAEDALASTNAMCSEIYARLNISDPPAVIADTLREMADALKSYAYWLDQREFWRKQS